jgi:hypothetical protein
MCGAGPTSESGAWQRNLMERGQKGCPLTGLDFQPEENRFLEVWSKQVTLSHLL